MSDHHDTALPPRPRELFLAFYYDPITGTVRMVSNAGDIDLTAAIYRRGGLALDGALKGDGRRLVVSAGGD